MRSEIIYEDKHILIIYKPSGIAVQNKAAFSMDVESELRNYLSKGASNFPFIGVVHRLDQPVEGVLIFGKSSRVTAILNKQLQENRLQKEYLAVVCGEVTEKKESFVDYLKKDSVVKRAIFSDKASGEFKKASLSYERLDYDESNHLSLVKIKIDTGRFHQIRAQMAYHGYPLFGDTKYGNDASLAMTKRLEGKQVALCANKIKGIHPITSREMEFQCSPKNPIFLYFQQKLEDLVIK